MCSKEESKQTKQYFFTSRTCFSFESTQFVDPEGLGQYCQPAHENQGLVQLHPMDQIREHTTNTSSLQLQQANITDGQTGKF